MGGAAIGMVAVCDRVILKLKHDKTAISKENSGFLIWRRGSELNQYKKRPGSEWLKTIVLSPAQCCRHERPEATQLLFAPLATPVRFALPAARDLDLTVIA